MEFELKKDYIRHGKLLKAGQILEVTEEMYDWLVENGYGDETKKKTKSKKDKTSE